eukprot:s706_g27.t1
MAAAINPAWSFPAEIILPAFAHKIVLEAACGSVFPVCCSHYQLFHFFLAHAASPWAQSTREFRLRRPPGCFQAHWSCRIKPRQAKCCLGMAFLVNHFISNSPEASCYTRESQLKGTLFLLRPWDLFQAKFISRGLTILEKRGLQWPWDFHP